MAEYEKDNLCDHARTELLIFSSNPERKVQRGRCLSHSDDGYIIYTGLDLTFGDMLAVTEWKVTITERNNVGHILKQVNSSEQEFTHLSKLRHVNLVRYLNMKHVQKEEEIVIHVVQEFVLGSNCNALFIRENLPVDMHMLRHIACGVLSALDFLHHNNILQKEFRNKSIFIDNNGVVKVSGYSLEVKLCSLATQPQNTESYSTKTDIYKFGQFISSLMKGSVVDISDVEISPAFPTELLDFLSKCLINDEQYRQSAAELLQHPFIRTPLQHLSPISMFEENAVPREISPIRYADEELKLNIGVKLNTQTSGGSPRIQHDFEEIESVGRGAFGDVLKVRNKLDGGYYAIKKIRLNPKDVELNQKITLEVALLSRLNHENVVRYYSSWIENTLLDSEQDSSADQSVDLSSCTFDSKSEHNVDTSPMALFEKKSDNEEDWTKCPMTTNMGLSDSIVFECGTDSDAKTSDSDSDDRRTQTGSNTPSQCLREKQFMYIQMEFCERSTLRTAIDSDLHLDMNRVWRLFREIVEGLAHIHAQQVIHRDLKPVNIFLDSNDNVKIGDFGLATTNIRQQQNVNVINRIALENNQGLSQDGDRSMTGHIGTALYIAPELSNTLKARYNYKVDIYSLGIILFEMFYGRLNTESERIEVLSNIRKREIVYPQEFNCPKYSDQRTVISMLLNHNVKQRPTSKAILRSRKVPLSVSRKSELQNILRNPQSKEIIVKSCFPPRKLNSAEDVPYDRSHPTTATQPLYDYVKQAALKVFNLHGGQCLYTPLMIPKTSHNSSGTCVNLMTSTGKIITISHDLRIPFARYVAWNGITQLKRYSIDRVYREEKEYFKLRVRELYECAFDIVTPNPGSLMADAELLSIVSEIIKKIPDLRKKDFVIRLNHTMLLKAILMYCKIPSDKHQDVYSILAETKDGEMDGIAEHLRNLVLPAFEFYTLLLLFFIKAELPIKEISVTLNSIMNGTDEPGYLAKHALGELSKIIQNTREMGVNNRIVISLGLVQNIDQYSGMMCQFTCALRKKRRHGGLEVIAAGGRYDSLLSSYRSTMERPGHDVSQAAVGISLSLDKLVQALQEVQTSMIERPCNLDAVVCSTGYRPKLKEKAKVLRKLWAAGIRCSLLETQSLEEIQDQCTKMRIPHIVILTDVDPSIARVRSWQNDRYEEQRKKVKTELIDYMLQLIKERTNRNSNKTKRNVSKTQNPIKIPPLSKEGNSGNSSKAKSDDTKAQVFSGHGTHRNVVPAPFFEGFPTFQKVDDFPTWL